MMLVPCEGVRQHLEAFHDGELPLETHLAVRAHLDECAGCAYEADALRSLSAALHEAPLGRSLAHGALPELRSLYIDNHEHLELIAACAARSAPIELRYW